MVRSDYVTDWPSLRDPRWMPGKYAACLTIGHIDAIGDSFLDGLRKYRKLLKGKPADSKLVKIGDYAVAYFHPTEGIQYGVLERRLDNSPPSVLHVD